MVCLMMDPQSCRNADDVLAHLVSWLQWVDEPQPRSGGWRQIMGFRRAFNITSVWKHDCGQYGMHVAEEYFDPEIEQFNIAKASSFKLMLEGASACFASQWAKAMV